MEKDKGKPESALHLPKEEELVDGLLITHSPPPDPENPTQNITTIIQDITDFRKRGGKIIHLEPSFSEDDLAKLRLSDDDIEKCQLDK